MKDPLAKTPADKLVIARQQLLAAKARVSELENVEPPVFYEKKHQQALQQSHEAQEKAMEQWLEALKNFDQTYGGA